MKNIIFVVITLIGVMAFAQERVPESGVYTSLYVNGFVDTDQLDLDKYSVGVLIELSLQTDQNLYFGICSGHIRNNNETNYIPTVITGKYFIGRTTSINVLTGAYWLNVNDGLYVPEFAIGFGLGRTFLSSNPFYVGGGLLLLEDSGNLYLTTGLTF